MEKPRGALIYTIEKGADVCPFSRWLRRLLYRRSPGAKVMPLRGGVTRKGGHNESFQFSERPPPPAPMRKHPTVEPPR